VSIIQEDICGSDEEVSMHVCIHSRSGFIYFYSNKYDILCNRTPIITKWDVGLINLPELVSQVYFIELFYTLTCPHSRVLVAIQPIEIVGCTILYYYMCAAVAAATCIEGAASIQVSKYM
jgi:hypothetical protein